MTESREPGDIPSAGQVSSPVLVSNSALVDRAPAEARDFDEIYAAYLPFVWRCLRGLGVPESGLDDAAQDVFVIVHRGLAEFRGASSVRTWLYGIVRNVASNRRRALGRAGPSEPLDERIATHAPDPVEQAQRGEAARFVQRFAASLSPKKREVFLLALLEEMSAPDVAQALSIPLNTVYSRLRAVRAEFETALEEVKR